MRALELHLDADALVVTDKIKFVDCESAEEPLSILTRHEVGRDYSGPHVDDEVSVYPSYTRMLADGVVRLLVNLRMLGDVSRLAPVDDGGSQCHGTERLISRVPRIGSMSCAGQRDKHGNE